ncbi:MAG: IS3 family transposase [Bacteroidetes bacterium]|nr:IS3 family transposase [Bacteroidota bacterium]
MEAITSYKLPKSRACALVNMSVSQFHYKAKQKDDSFVIQEIKECITKRQHGCPMITKMIRNKGHKINHKRIERVYKELLLTLPKKVRKKLPKREQSLILQPLQENICWSMDFMSDSLMDGRKFRTLNIIDDYNRECLSVDVEISIPTKRLIRALERLKAQGKLPKELRIDNGPENVSHELRKWAYENNVKLTFIQPGKPTQNSLIERFNGTCRRELLNSNLFYSLDHARELAAEWMYEYNFERPHSALGNRTPIEFKLWRASLLESKSLAQKPSGVGVGMCF